MNSWPTTLRRNPSVVALLGLVLAIPAAASTGAAAREPVPTEGAPGAGDRYFPRDGNGGYDVRRYLLDLRYHPARDRLAGTAVLKARATQNLSSFNLDLAHQRFGESLAVRRWRHIWLNEGFATYAEWLWLEREGVATAGQVFRDYYGIPDRDPFWDLRIGDPGPGHLFDFAVYNRGAMTLHRLRVRVGDQDFFRILRRWARTRAGDNVTTAGFIRLAERVSGESLDRLFLLWLFTPGRPRLPGPPGAEARAVRHTPHGLALGVRSQHRLPRK